MTLFAQWFFLLYFIGLNGGYFLLNLLSLFSMSRFAMRASIYGEVRTFSGEEPGISILAPAYNEELSIVASVRSLLQLNYPDYEVIVIDDGSKDRTLELLIEHFALEPFPQAYLQRLSTNPVRAIYQSAIHPRLKVVSKDNGGKASALNCGINLAQYDYFCAIDADSVLQRDSLYRVIQPFLEDPDTIACGGTIRIANGCTLRDGWIMNIDLPKKWLARFQIGEYLRAMLFGRLGWSPLNGLLIISGAFGVYRTETVIAAGGYQAGTIGEDMELVMRLHRYMCDRQEPYRISFLPDPLCWTEAPEDLRTLKNQRVRWQRGLLESLFANLGLLFHRHGGTASWLAFPFMLIFEALGPLIEVTGLLFMSWAWYTGRVNGQAMAAFMLATLGLGILLSVSALLLEEMSFHLYPRVRHTLILMTAAILENFGYRQLNSVWRLTGLLRWMFRTRSVWGEMRRNASLQQK